MKEIRIRSYYELISIINEIDSTPIIKCNKQIRKYYYRGQSDSRWKLIPNMLRDNCKSEPQELEKLCIEDNEVESKIFLALAQHYGRKTRCLDFSRNYKVALYFACNPDDDAYNQDGALYIWEKDAHKPNWFTNYVAYYTARAPFDEISSWDYAEYISSKQEIREEFQRTGRSTEIDEVNCEIQWYLAEGFMVDFEGYDHNVRIKKQEAALFYFGSEYFILDGEKRIIVNGHLRHWSNQNRYYINLHKLYDLNIESSEYCTKIIIPQQLKKEIFEKININKEDLGL